MPASSVNADGLGCLEIHDTRHRGESWKTLHMVRADRSSTLLEAEGLLQPFRWVNKPRITSRAIHPAPAVFKALERNSGPLQGFRHPRLKKVNSDPSSACPDIM